MCKTFHRNCNRVIIVPVVQEATMVMVNKSDHPSCIMTEFVKKITNKSSTRGNNGMTGLAPLFRIVLM